MFYLWKIFRNLFQCIDVENNIYSPRLSEYDITNWSFLSLVCSLHAVTITDGAGYSYQGLLKKLLLFSGPSMFSE